MEEKYTEQELIRREKADELKALGIDPFGQKFVRSHTSTTLKEEYKNATQEELHNNENLPLVSIAGRIMTKRGKGKVGFAHIQDQEGQIQIYVRKDLLTEQEYYIFEKSDLGDIIGVTGVAMITNTGEFTLKVLKYQHLVKALRPLPDKFHGLQDVEERYRRRYVDLIMNEDAKRIAILRPRIIRGIQNFMDGRGFIEVETPVLQPILGGASARPFVTHHNALDMDFYLRIATEISLKKLLVGGIERVYEIGRLFRNEGMDTTHNPEFTTIEAYQSYGDLDDMMELCESLIRSVATSALGKTTVMKNEVEIDFSKPFRRATMVDLVKEYAGVDFKNHFTFEEAKDLALEHGIEVEKHHTGVGHILNLFFEKYCEDKIVQPTFVCGHPIEISPLTKKDPEDPRFTQRFELFICGNEYANAYTELNDPIDQKERFVNQLKERELGNDEANQMDDDFIEALEYGMPPAGGIGIGIDRLVILLTEASSIREVLLFPHMKKRKQ